LRYIIAVRVRYSCISYPSMVVPVYPVFRIGASVLAVLLDQARKKTIRVCAEKSPFDLKDVLKRRGYRWCDGSDRSWYIDVGEDQLGNEIAFLKTEIYLSEVEPRLQTLTALSRFSVRA
ncbi:MAG: polymerase subunit epsilon, partial [Acidobacteriales bacterium]|nr:polymerase subunit epsilon [Terriglobales bacterium]